MIIRSTTFIKSAVNPDAYPDAILPEVAFCGRSNVGKSSLINILVNRKSLVRTSSTPGRTQLINFFTVNDTLSLVDLPGFGYAEVPLPVKKAWGPMMRTYFEGRPNLCAVILLFDIRRIPREEELMLIDWTRQYDIPLIPVVTKADKITKGQRAKHVKDISAASGIDANEFILFSTVSREGRDAIWDRIEAATAGFALSQGERSERDAEEGEPEV